MMQNDDHQYCLICLAKGYKIFSCKVCQKFTPKACVDCAAQLKGVLWKREITASHQFCKTPPQPSSIISAILALSQILLVHSLPVLQTTSSFPVEKQAAFLYVVIGQLPAFLVLLALPRDWSSLKLPRFLLRNCHLRHTRKPKKINDLNQFCHLWRFRKPQNLSLIHPWRSRVGFQSLLVPLPWFQCFQLWQLRVCHWLQAWLVMAQFCWCLQPTIIL